MRYGSPGVVDHLIKSNFEVRGQQLDWNQCVGTVLASGPSVRGRFVHPTTRPYWSPAQPSKKKGPRKNSNPKKENKEEEEDDDVEVEGEEDLAVLLASSDEEEERARVAHRQSDNIDDYGKPLRNAKGEMIGYRQMTSRELARAQGFPDNFIFAVSSYLSVNRMIGNAVPPPLGCSIGHEIEKAERKRRGEVSEEADLTWRAELLALEDKGVEMGLEEEGEDRLKILKRERVQKKDKLLLNLVDGDHEDSSVKGLLKKKSKKKSKISKQTEEKNMEENLNVVEEVRTASVAGDVLIEERFLDSSDQELLYKPRKKPRSKKGPSVKTSTGPVVKTPDVREQRIIRAAPITVIDLTSL